MRNKLLMGVVGLALSASMIVTASLSASAANCSVCQRANMSLEHHIEVDCDFVNPDTHMITYWDFYDCLFDTCPGSYDEYSYVYEAHDYDLIEATNTMVCLGCGDSYNWAH